MVLELPLRLPFSRAAIDRRGEQRRDAAYLAELSADPAALVLLVAEGARVATAAEGGLGWVPLSARPDAGELVFLGLDPDGRPLFAAEVDRPEDLPASFASLRDVGAELADAEAAAALQAVAITTWRRRAPYCPSCGSPTVVEDAGHLLRCSACGTGHFPRTDPAVIMLVHDGDRCVLGQRVGAPNGRWSTLAGFVEAGESLESAVCREVAEEVGLVVDDLVYRGSQPWPFPQSLMVAFEAHAPYGPLVANHEHQAVRWFGRDELASAIAAGSVTIPGPISAGSFLIRSFLARES